MLTNVDSIKKTSIYCLCIIILSMFLCGCRNAILASIVSCLVIFKYLKIYNKNKFNIFIISFFSFVVLLISISNISDFFIVHLRLNQEDVSSGRLEQYGLFFSMLDVSGFWGLGHGESTNYFYTTLGKAHALHNTFMKIIAEYGWLYGMAVIIFSTSLIIKIISSYKKRNANVVFWGSIIVSGLMTAMFEPGAIFGYLGGACLWWFALGVFLCMYRNKTENKIINI